jgi:hypothetical protein
MGGGPPEEGIEIVRDMVSLARLQQLAAGQFGDLVKAVVDMTTGIMVIGGELHADEEAVLLELGSAQADLWGINLYPAQYGETDWIEFDSMINIRPRHGNRSRGVEDANRQRAIIEIVGRLVRPDD